MSLSCQSGQPHCIDPYTLVTIGVDEMDGTFNIGMPFDTGFGYFGNYIASEYHKLLGAKISALNCLAPLAFYILLRHLVFPYALIEFDGQGPVS